MMIQRKLTASNVTKVVWSMGSLDDEGYYLTKIGGKYVLKSPTQKNIPVFMLDGKKSFYIEAVPSSNQAYKQVAGVDDEAKAGRSQAAASLSSSSVVAQQFPMHPAVLPPIQEEQDEHEGGPSIPSSANAFDNKQAEPAKADEDGTTLLPIPQPHETGGQVPAEPAVPPRLVELGPTSPVDNLRARCRQLKCAIWGTKKDLGKSAS
eukprot:6488561-Amphidinium_carterae.1